MTNKIKVTYEDLKDPKVDEILAQESSSIMSMGPRADLEDMGEVSFIHKSWFHLMLAGLIGAFIAWALVEPYFEDIEVNEARAAFFGFLLFSSVGGLAGLMIGSMEGFLARNYSRALKGGFVGLVVGFFGGLISLLFAGIVITIVATIGWEILEVGDPTKSLTGFITLVITRSLGWMVVGMTVGLGPGIALKSRKLMLNGFLGGMIGGLIGGILFDPINYLVSSGTFETGAEVSRAIGLSIIGASAGLMIGLVEMLTKDAWLLMTAGPLTGKQFIIYKNPTIIGSSPKCEIYLFKDPSIEPFHAAIHTVRDGYEIEDKNTPRGTWINGQRIKRKRLQNGDEIQTGEAKFNFSEKEKKT